MVIICYRLDLRIYVFFFGSHFFDSPQEIWPYSFDPIARFVVNIDWDAKEIELDASPSRTYKNTIGKYIWRIDDGTSIIGSEKLSHQFQYPGYYRIHLSIIDSNNQSDYATCTIFLAPEEVEKTETQQSRVLEESQKGEETTQYRWTPKGSFINYSRYLESRSGSIDQAHLLSNFVGNECGFSQRPYNIVDLSSNISDRNAAISKSIAMLIANILATIF